MAKRGIAAETMIIDVMMDYGAKKATKIQDEFEGTDMIFDGVRMDFTLDMERKNYTTIVGSFEYGCVEWEVGIRTGNGKASFKEYVLVFGIKTRLALTQIAEYVEKCIDGTFIQKLFDLYWNGVDQYGLDY